MDRVSGEFKREGDVTHCRYGDLALQSPQRFVPEGELVAARMPPDDPKFSARLRRVIRIVERQGVALLVAYEGGDTTRVRSGSGFGRQGTNIVGEVPAIVVCPGQAGSIRGHRGAVEPCQEGAYQVLECGAILKGRRPGEVGGLDLEPGYVPQVRSG